MHALGIDDAYKVDRTLASGPGGVTELVSLDGSVPFIRKRIPSKLARRGVWAMLSECGCARLPHVAATYEMPDEFVVVCDFVPGENLEQLVAERGRLSQGDAFQIVSQLCEAAQALHARGIVHRDISPTNVIVAADGAHLIDLGIARFRNEDVAHDTTQLGTRGFASPEQCGYAQTDARSDVYSLGRILGYLLTGVRPETPDTAEYERALADEAVVSPEAREIVRRASAMEPSARYQSAQALAAALSGEKGVEPDVPLDSVVPPAFESAPRRRGWVKVLLAVMAVVAFVAAVAIILAQTLGANAGEKNVDVPPVAEEPVTSEPEAESDPVVIEKPAESDADLEIVESGWSVDSHGYVHYAFGLRNPNDYVIDLPGVKITGRDEAGKVLFSSEQYLNVIGAEETSYFGSQVGGDVEPATVEFESLPVEDYKIGLTGSESSFKVSNVSASVGAYGTTTFAGDVTTVSDDGKGIGSDVALTVVLRDESDAIVYGATTYVTRPGVGESTSFALEEYGVPDYATYEVYAQPW